MRPRRLRRLPALVRVAAVPGSPGGFKKVGSFSEGSSGPPECLRICRYSPVSHQQLAICGIEGLSTNEAAHRTIEALCDVSTTSINSYPFPRQVAICKIRLHYFAFSLEPNAHEPSSGSSCPKYKPKATAFFGQALVAFQGRDPSPDACSPLGTPKGLACGRKLRVAMREVVDVHELVRGWQRDALLGRRGKCCDADHAQAVSAECKHLTTLAAHRSQSSRRHSA